MIKIYLFIYNDVLFKIEGKRGKLKDFSQYFDKKTSSITEKIDSLRRLASITET